MGVMVNAIGGGEGSSVTAVCIVGDRWDGGEHRAVTFVRSYPVLYTPVSVSILRRHHDSYSLKSD